MCTHAFATEEFMGIRQHVPTAVPEAAAVQDDAVSDSEPTPKRRRRQGR